ncbi:hypothetical protein PR048_005778 [Dryococelus australis]|uniref:Uncharacterized protein n=1 Tax=Dryococelus australis TaxID=614101 RepID=A0ABQ9I956_9NEOP|nr:hypothetical protein PR048_005778 [Dryococelus australis]
MLTWATHALGALRMLRQLTLLKVQTNVEEGEEEEEDNIVIHTVLPPHAGLVNFLSGAGLNHSCRTLHVIKPATLLYNKKKYKRNMFSMLTNAIRHRAGVKKTWKQTHILLPDTIQVQKCSADFMGTHPVTRHHPGCKHSTGCPGDVNMLLSPTRPPDLSPIDNVWYQIGGQLQPAATMAYQCQLHQLLQDLPPETSVWLPAGPYRRLPPCYGWSNAMLKASCKCCSSAICTWCAAVIYGRAHEKRATAAYENEIQVTVQPCGPFAHPEVSYLGTSPDGVLEKYGIVYVKCIPSIGCVPIRETAKSKKPFIEENNRKLQFKKIGQVSVPNTGAAPHSRQEPLWFNKTSLEEMGLSRVNGPNNGKIRQVFHMRKFGTWIALVEGKRSDYMAYIMCPYERKVNE